MLPSNFERSSSLDGILQVVNASASYKCPSTTPAFNSRAFASFANLQRILAGAVASSLEIAIALGPSKCFHLTAKSVPSKARFHHCVLTNFVTTPASLTLFTKICIFSNSQSTVVNQDNAYCVFDVLCNSLYDWLF